MKVFTSFILASLLCSGSLYAKKPEHAGNGNKGKKEKKHKNYKKQNKHFSSKDANMINSYYKNLPPGLQKKMKKGGQLPPGWSKKVSIGKPVPDEYIKIAVPAPKDLKIKLDLDSNIKLLQISNKLIKVEVGTNRLLGEIQF